MLPEKIELVYIGSRDIKMDNVCNTGTIWFGYGDAQPVEKKYLPKFLMHPDVWMLKEKFVAGDKTVKVFSTANVNVKSQKIESKNNEAHSVTGEDKSSTESTPDLTAIKTAILSLESGNPEHFSVSNGVPILGAVRALASNESITAAHVRAAWAELNVKAQ